MRVRHALECVPQVAALAVAAALVVGTGATAAPAGGNPPTATFHNSFLRFTHPVRWTPFRFERTAAPHVEPPLYLSNQTLHDPCRQQGPRRVCGWPVDRLARGGVLIVWENRTFPRWSLDASPGTLLRVGGRSARRSAARPGECGAIGADETIAVAIDRPIPNSWTAFTACLRRPDLAAAERQIAALLASTRFTAP